MTAVCQWYWSFKFYKEFFSKLISKSDSLIEKLRQDGTMQ